MKRVLISLFFCCAGLVQLYGQTDIAVKGVFPMEYQVPGSHHFYVGVADLGPMGIGYMDVYWQEDNGAVQHIQVPPGAAQGGLIDDAGLTVSFPVAGTYTLKVWVKAFSPADTNALNDTVTQTVRVLNTLPKKNVLLEVFKHLACCPCYDAAQFEDTVISNNSGYAIANIYTVQTDAIYLADGQTVDNTYYYGHPMPLLDRYKFAYQPLLSTMFYSNSAGGYSLDGYGLREQFYEPVKVGFKSVIYNDATRELRVKVSAQFYDELNGDYRFNLYLTEDSIKAYQGCAPDPNNYYHMFVLRAMAGGPWGMQGSLPAVLHINDVKEYEFVYTIPAAYKTKDMRLIGFVQAYDADSLKRRVLNTEQIKFEDALTLGNAPLNSLKGNIKIYPNPVDNEVNISLGNISGKTYVISVVDMNGKVLMKLEKDSDVVLNLVGLAPGNYIIKLDVGKEVYTKMIKKE